MARVPVYDGAQVRSNALQPVMQREIDVSSGVRAAGQTLAGLGDVMDRKVRDEADLEAFAAQERILAAQNDWEVKARSIAQGEKAVGYRAQVEDWWKTAREKEFQNLSPLAQQRAARALSAAYRASVEAAGNYERQQVEIGARARLGGSLAQLQAQALKAGPEGAPAVLAAGAETIRAFGRERGIDVTPEVTKFTSGVHLNMIEALSQTNAADARRYFNDHRDQIDSGVWDRVEKVITAEALNQEARAKAAANAGKPLAEQLAAGADMAPALRERYLTEVRNNHALVKQAQAEQEAAASDEAWDYVRKGKRVPEAVLDRMGGEKAAMLEKYIADRARIAADRAEGKPVKTDPALMARLLDMARDNPTEFARMRLEPLSLKLGNSDMELVSRMQRDLLKPDKEKDVATTMQIIDAAGASLTTEQRSAFKLAVLDEIYRQERASGKPLDYKQKRELTDTMLLGGEVLSGRWWQNDPNKKLYEVAPADRARFAPDDPARKRQVEAMVPPVQVKSVEEARALKPGTRFIDPNGVERIR